jgi:MarR family transcriptional regulator, organic hydroperoxide resistance regulator
MAMPNRMDPANQSFNLFKSPFYLIAHADFKYHEDLDKVMSKVGVDRTTYRLLTVLMQEGPANIKDVCEHALLKRSTGGRAIERMRDKGWVKTTLNEGDHRVTDVELTSSGRRMAQSLREVTSRQLHRAVSGFSAAELRQFDNMLARIIANLSRLPIE